MAAKPRVKQPSHGRNRTAVEETLVALRHAGRLEQVDSARVAIVQSLADAVDADPMNASLWREFRAAESALRITDDHDQDEFGQLLEALSAEVGDSSPAGTVEPRGRGGGGGEDFGSAVDAVAVDGRRGGKRA